MNEAIYKEAIGNGCSESMAQILASRKFPATQTDKQFFSRFKSMGDELPEGYMNSVIKCAKRDGYDPCPGDVYLPGLARKTGDPDAFVSRATGARAKIKKHVERCERGPEKDPYALENRVPLREDIVQDFVREKVAEDPGLLERRTIGDVREEVIAKHGPKV